MQEFNQCQFLLQFGNAVAEYQKRTTAEPRQDIDSIIENMDPVSMDVAIEQNLLSERHRTVGSNSITTEMELIASYARKGQLSASDVIAIQAGSLAAWMFYESMC